MKKALFGRMKEGVCGTINFGYIGCSKDVLDIMDIECSGKTSCSILMTAQTFKAEPCMQLRNYLETEHICQHIIESGVSRCQSCDGIKITSPVGYLSSEMTSKTKCGSASCPWLLIAEKGQTIEIKLHDFSNKTSIVRGQKCQVYALIKEKIDDNPSTVCGSSSRESEVYTSKSNQLNLQMIFENRSPFLLGYRFIGCKDFLDKDMIFLRQGNKAQIKCRNTNEKYNLECINNEWKDLETIMCSMKKYNRNGLSLITWDLWAILISSICFMLGCFIIVFRLWCFCRDRSLRMSQMAVKSNYDDIYNEPLPSKTLNRKFQEQYHHDRMKDYDPRFHDYSSDLNNYNHMTLPKAPE